MQHIVATKLVEHQPTPMHERITTAIQRKRGTTNQIAKSQPGIADATVVSNVDFTVADGDEAGADVSKRRRSARRRASCPELSFRDGVFDVFSVLTFSVDRCSYRCRGHRSGCIASVQRGGCIER
jgi:hypothetical protein